MEKLSARIDNWSVVDNLIFNGFRALEPGQRLTGHLMGHTDLPNGIIYTSVIQNVDLTNGLVETGNTIYRLGRASADYERWASDTRAIHEVRVPTFIADVRKPVTTYPAVAPMHAFRQG